MSRASEIPASNRAARAFGTVCFIVLTTMALISITGCSVRPAEQDVVERAPSFPAGTEDTGRYFELKLYYGTDRAETTVFPASWSSSKRSAHKFSGLRNDSGIVTYGTVRVSIPYTHEVGELDDRLFASDDPARSIVLLSAKNENVSSWVSQLRQELGSSTGRSALVYIHGYNVSFRDAARRCAQLAFDLEFSGVPMFFSWPSMDSTQLYTIDEATIEWTMPHLIEFLRTAIGEVDAQNVYIIAHSMGARATARALEALSRTDAELFERVKHVIFAAPDIDADVFKSQILPSFVSLTDLTLYASAGDVPIGASNFVHRYPRAGSAGETILVSAPLVTIDATGLDTSFLGHSYYATTEPMIGDIKEIIAGLPIDSRSLIRRSARGHYYEFRPEVIP